MRLVHVDYPSINIMTHTGISNKMLFRNVVCHLFGKKRCLTVINI